MIKKLAKRVKGYTLSTVLTPLLVAVEVILEVIIPTVMGELIDKGIEARDMNSTMKIGALLVVLCILSLFAGAASGWNAATASAGFAKNLRRDMYYNVQRFSFSNIDKFSTSSIVTRLTTDVTNVQNAFQMVIRIAVRCPAMLIFSLIMAFRINSQLSLIFLAIIPFMGIALGLIIGKASPVFERVFKNYDKLNNVVQENLHGIRVVKSFVREDYENKKFKNVSGRIYKDFLSAKNFWLLTRL